MNWELRRLYGEVYALTFADGMEVPWTQLSYGEYLHYSNLLTEGRVPAAYVEDEIFQKCVLSPALLESMDFLKAGRVSVVAHAILTSSGPSDPDKFNLYLESKRQEIEKPLEQLVLFISRAFPQYKLEEIYAMNYDQFTMRLAQAEHVLMASKRIDQPISLYREQKTEAPKPSARNLKERFDEGARQKEAEVSSFMAHSKGKKQWIPQELPPKPSMEEMKAKRDKIEFSKDNRELSMAGGLMGHEVLDGHITEAKVMKNMEKIYPHLFKKAAEQTK